MAQNRKIGLLGLVFHTGNKGCEALGYGFLEALDGIARARGEVFDVVVFQNLPVKQAAKNFYRIGAVKELFSPHWAYENLRCSVSFYRMVLGRYFYDRKPDCDIAFDFTQGDSFSDIYGDSRFKEVTALKEDFVSRGIPLVLGPQTIGPFKKKANRERAGRVIEACRAVYVRDRLSGKYVKKISAASPILTMDAAFFLPYEKKEFPAGRRRIGLNVSGLLWYGGYTRDNQFGLSLDYRRYIEGLLEALCADEGMEVHLISHATSERKNFPDNDWAAAEELHSRFSKTVLVPKFSTPNEAKAYISGMDLFIGSRMHATIAAISTEVPVIPVSYSRKFEGLFGTLSYGCLITAASADTQEALDRTLGWIRDPSPLLEGVRRARPAIDAYKEEFVRSVDALLL